MKKKFLTFILSLCLIVPSMFILSACKDKDNNYVIIYDYGVAKEFFDTAQDKDEIKPATWITSIPSIKSDYSEIFMGWFIKGTDVKIQNYDFIGGNVTLEARFDIEKSVPAGLYQQGKYVMSWSEMLEKYPDAFVDNSIVCTNNNQTYFEAYNFIGDLVIDNTITTIGKHSMQGLYLTSIKIPTSVTSIGEKAFIHCSNLKSIAIPSSVTSIGDEAFAFCSSLTSINIPSNITLLGNGVFKSCENLTTITLPTNLTSIGEWTFYKCWSLTNIEIPSNVISIGSYAFADCRSLVSITIPNKVETLGGQVFWDCVNLESVIIPTSLTYIGSGTFSECSNVKVYYSGDLLEWDNVGTNAGKENVLVGAPLYTYSENQPTADGNYWHYDVDGITPIAW